MAKQSISSQLDSQDTNSCDLLDLVAPTSASRVYNRLFRPVGEAHDDLALLEAFGLGGDDLADNERKHHVAFAQEDVEPVGVQAPLEPSWKEAKVYI